MNLVYIKNKLKMYNYMQVLQVFSFNQLLFGIHDEFETLREFIELFF